MYYLFSLGTELPIKRELKYFIKNEQCFLASFEI